MTRETDTMRGVSDAWNDWLFEHSPGTVPNIIEEAVKKAVAAWLDAHGAVIVKAAVSAGVETWLEAHGAEIMREDHT